MCGRLTLTATADEILEQFSIINSVNFPYEANYNIAPSQKIAAIVGSPKGNRIGQLRWGLIPSWASDEKIGYKMINARSETLLEKRSFKNLITRRRCALLADGFYEWKATSEGKKPYRITLANEKPFLMAGLWDRWSNDEGIEINSCTIITTSANRLLSEVHDRMPVILTNETEKTWLNPKIDISETYTDVLQPYSSESMTMYEVSQLVNSPKNNKLECMLPV
jgi:putative SOS response-associated peptidase YedK